VKKYFRKYWNYKSTVALLLLFSFSAVSFVVDLHSCICNPKAGVKVETKSCCKRETKTCGTEKKNDKQCEKKKRDCNNCGKCSFDKNEFENPVSTTSGNLRNSETVIFNTSSESVYDHTSCHQVPANISPPGATPKKYISALRI
jgi:hypothetical protein